MQRKRTKKKNRTRAILLHTTRSVSNFWIFLYFIFVSFLPQNCNISSVLSIFKYNPGKISNTNTNNSTVNNTWSFLSIEYHTDETPKKKATNYCVRSSVVRYGPQSVASATWLTSKIVMFPQFSVYSSIIQAKQAINLLLIIPDTNT